MSAGSGTPHDDLARANVLLENAYGRAGHQDAITEPLDSLRIVLTRVAAELEQTGEWRRKYGRAAHELNEAERELVRLRDELGRVHRVLDNAGIGEGTAAARVGKMWGDVTELRDGLRWYADEANYDSDGPDHDSAVQAEGLDRARALLSASQDEQRCDYCGDIEWTVRFGEPTLKHKHNCPHRVDAFCQTHPDGCASQDAEQQASRGGDQ